MNSLAVADAPLLTDDGALMRRLLAWMAQASSFERADAINALARAYLYSELSPEARASAEIAMTRALDDPELRVRRALAEALAGARDAPRALVLSLARDASAVARVVLTHSPLLRDADLVDCVGYGDAAAQANRRDRGSDRRPFGMSRDAADDAHEELEQYLKGLISYAEMFGQRACFKFVRGGLRASFLRRILGGRHIYINRPPAEIVASHCSFGPANYFTRTLVEILATNAGVPFCAGAIEGLRTHGPLDAASMKQIAGGDSGMAETVAMGLNVRQRHLLTIAFWLAYLLEGLAACDLVIDTERLSESEDYRCEMTATTQSLFDASGFRDFRPTNRKCELDAPLATIAEIVGASERLQGLARSLGGEAIASLGEGSRRILESVL